MPNPERMQLNIALDVDCDPDESAVVEQAGDEFHIFAKQGRRKPRLLARVVPVGKERTMREPYSYKERQRQLLRDLADAKPEMSK